MFRSAFVIVCLLCCVAATDTSAAVAGKPRYPRRVMPGDHHPVYTRYGHHSLSRQGLFNLFRPNGSGIARKKRFKKSRA